MRLTRLYTEFFNSEKAGGIVLLLCATLSIALANSSLQAPYISFWKMDLAGEPLDYWINEGLMTIFFLLIGLEIEREIRIGELSYLRNALLPLVAATGGMLVPAGIYLFFNAGTVTQPGAGIPMATDIAFALGILSLLNGKVPASLKVFLTALAIIDDLGAILTIAIFYSKGLSLINLAIAISIFLVLLIINRLRVVNLLPYVIGGIAMWYFMLHSGVHATISGVLLAFVIPFGKGNKKSTSFILQHSLHIPVSFIILPLFALANTAISIPRTFSNIFLTNNGKGIFLGLLFGKPIGIILFSAVAVATGVCAKPDDLKWKHFIGLGLLGGIGFTMSIFISLLAFDDVILISNTKVVIIFTSSMAALLGLIALSFSLREKSAKTLN